jgi:hypothetical protein
MGANIPPLPPPPLAESPKSLAEKPKIVVQRKFEYKHIRLDYKGRGITQEINILDIDGQRIRGWGSSSEVPTLPEILAALGEDGWEMISHAVNQDNVTNGVSFHYYNFKRALP